MRPLNWYERALVVLGLFSLCVPPAGVWMVREFSKKQWEVYRDSERFCESLIPRIENYRERLGVVPTRIEEILTDADQVPSSLLDEVNKDSWYRWVDADSYRFDLYATEPLAVFAPFLRRYDSDSRTWGSSSG